MGIPNLSMSLLITILNLLSFRRYICLISGSKLASPLTADLASVMRSIMEQAGIKCGAYTGIHAYFSRGDFHSVEGNFQVL